MQPEKNRNLNRLRLALASSRPPQGSGLAAVQCRSGDAATADMATYNTVHPHRALRYRSPRGFIASRLNQENLSGL